MGQGFLRVFSIMADSIVSIVLKPTILLPTLLTSFVELLVILFSSEYIERLVEDFVLFDNFANVSLSELPVYLLTNYFLELTALMLTLVITFALYLYVLFVYAIFLEREAIKKSKGFVGSIANNPLLASKKNTIINDMIFALRAFPQILNLTFFYFVLYLLFIVFLGVVLFLSLLLPSLTIVFLIMTSLGIIGFAYFSIVFLKTPIIMATTGEKLRLALSTSWAWCSKNFLQTIFFVFVLLFTSYTLNYLFDSLTALIETEELAEFIGLILNSFTFSFLLLSFTKFFHSGS
ncbi:MAG: hypothetical protein QXU92_01035 [Candidatus Diapherotrites archaeon]